MDTKAKRFIDKVIAKAKKERDRRGYRENLGYDQDMKVGEYLNTLEPLSYSQRHGLMTYFYQECDTI